MLEILLVVIALIGSFAAGIYDLKTTNIPDEICILMIMLGLIMHIITGVYTGNFTMFLNSLLFGGIFLIFGLIMYYGGQWGGGDGELLVALGVLLPNLSLVKTYFPFAISFFINSFFVGVAWSILYSLYFAYKNDYISRNFFQSFKDPLTISTAIITLFLSITFFIIPQLIFSLLFLLLFVLFIFMKFAKVIEKGFYFKIPVSKLKVDDMLGEDIPKLKLYRRFIKGLTKEQVKKIKKNRKYVIIREGVRYGIVFPLALLFTLFFGDFFLFFL